MASSSATSASSSPQNSYFIYLDGDVAVWHRTSNSSSSSSSQQQEKNPWQDVSCDYAVQQSFAAVSHMSALMKTANSVSSLQQQQQHRQGESSYVFDEYTSFSIGPNSSISSNNNVTSKHDNSEEESMNTQNKVTTTGFLKPMQNKFHSLRDIGLPNSSNSNNNNQSGSNEGGSDFYSSISLPLLFSHFANLVVATSAQSSSSSSPSSVRFVALLGRSAGIEKSSSSSMLEEEEATQSSRKLEERILKEAAEKISEFITTTTISFDIILLPKAQTFASLISNNTSDKTEQETNPGQKNNGDDEDLVACKEFAKKVLRLLSNTKSCNKSNKIQFSVDRARDCSDIGGCVARAFLDHGK